MWRAPSAFSVVKLWPAERTPRSARRLHHVYRSERRVPVFERHFAGSAARLRCRCSGAVELCDKHGCSEESPDRYRGQDPGDERRHHDRRPPECREGSQYMYIALLHTRGVSSGTDNSAWRHRPVRSNHHALQVVSGLSQDERDWNARGRHGNLPALRNEHHRLSANGNSDSGGSCECRAGKPPVRDQWSSNKPGSYDFGVRESSGLHDNRFGYVAGAG